MPTLMHLNEDWNAEPNGPEPICRWQGDDLLLQFAADLRRYPGFRQNDPCTLRFKNVSRYRSGGRIDEHWDTGRGRYSGIAAAFGGFYELQGSDPQLDESKDWHVVAQPVRAARRHFLFYTREFSFEVLASSWSFELPSKNTSLRYVG